MNTPVVSLDEVQPSIVRVTMHDRENKNTFSEELIRDLSGAFEQISTLPNCKVVILTGYDSYFASGGTQESLLYLSAGKGTFQDIAESRGSAGGNLYALNLECPVPCISAMQGHGIGGGFVMGLFADFVVLSRESLYTTNFMKYGFTPGMGATLVVPEKLGTALGWEMLLTAKSYYGADLQKRGISFPVLPRAEVMPYALELAQSLAEKPRLSLVTLKQHLVASIRERLPRVVEQELQMHSKTLSQPEVKERIEALFGR